LLGLYVDRRLTWAHHIYTKRIALNNRSRQLRLLLTSKHINLSNKILLYKLLLKPIWSYGIQLCGSAKPSNIKKIQTFQSKCLRQITKAPFSVSNDILHNDLSIPIVQHVAKTLYKRFHSNLLNHRNPLIVSGSPDWIKPIHNFKKFYHWMDSSLKSSVPFILFYFILSLSYQHLCSL